MHFERSCGHTDWQCKVARNKPEALTRAPSPETECEVRNPARLRRLHHWPHGGAPSTRRGFPGVRHRRRAAEPSPRLSPSSHDARNLRNEDAKMADARRVRRQETLRLVGMDGLVELGRAAAAVGD